MGYTRCYVEPFIDEILSNLCCLSHVLRNCTAIRTMFLPKIVHELNDREWLISKVFKFIWPQKSFKEFLGITE